MGLKFSGTNYEDQNGIEKYIKDGTIIMSSELESTIASTRPPRDSFIRQKGLLCSPFFSLFSDMCHTISAVLPRMASNAIWYLHIAAQSFIMTGYVTNHAALCRATTFKLERMDNK